MGPLFSEWSVNAHEARPGHHTQVGQFYFFQTCMCVLSDLLVLFYVSLILCVVLFPKALNCATYAMAESLIRLRESGTMAM